jgi:hypothetical protein
MHISLITHDKKLLALARKRNVLTRNFDALLDLMATAGIIDESVHTVAIQTLAEYDMRPH